MKAKEDRSTGHDGKNQTRKGRSNNKDNRNIVPAPRITDAAVKTLPSPAALEKRQQFYKSQEIDSDLVASTPKISHILASIPGGIHQAIEYIYGSEEKEARAFVKMYDKLIANPATLDCLVTDAIPFEAFCVKLNISSKRMLEVVMGACFEQSNSASTLFAAAAHPTVVRATVEAALFPDGHNDRKLLHQHSRFIPTPKNTFVAPGGSYSEINDNSIGRTGNNQTVAVSELTRIEGTMQKIADRFNERMGISSASAPPATDIYQEGEVAPEPDAEEIPDAIEVESSGVDPDAPILLEPTESDWAI